MNDEKNKLAGTTLDQDDKLLLVIRHAKSSWDIATLNDFERPLNERGKKDAPMMAKRLLDKKIAIDNFVSSPAKRAKKTARLFAEEFERKKEEIILIPELYHASVQVFFEAISNVDDIYKSIAVFSHNPGITSFANELTENNKIDNMPTCSVFAVRCHIENWCDFKTAKKDFWFFDYPKNVAD